MTVRVLGSWLIGLLIGAGLGLFLGWEVIPLEPTNSTIDQLAPPYQETYTLMVAQGYVHDKDINGAIERLRWLYVANIPAFVQEMAERYISQSRNLEDIRLLVALSEGLGRLTPPMQNFRYYSLNADSTP